MIEVMNISKSWGDFALRDVSLDMSKQGYLVILGPCGSGKTLLLESIVGLHTPQTGRIVLNGRDITRLPPERRHISLLYQHFALFPHLSIRKNIEYGLRYRGLKRSQRRARAEEMIDMLGIRYLAERSSPVGLSGGESQMVALARALAVEPKVLLLDEPLSSLDSRARRVVKELLRGIGARLNIPVIHVTHDFDEAASLADRVAVMNNGSIVQAGPAEEVFWHPKSRFVAEFLGVSNIFDAECIGRENCTCLVRMGDITLTADRSVRCGPASVCIRPEDVEIRKSRDGSNNIFPSRVREVTDLRFDVRVRVATDSVELLALVPRRAFAALGVTAGSDVFVHLPPESLHVIESDAGDGQNNGNGHETDEGRRSE